MNDRYSIVSGDPRANKADVLALLAGNFAMLAPELRYAKYYERNPVGPPRLCLAHDRESDAFVGMAALFPARIRVDGALVAAALSADFVVDEGHRGFGPALGLQRALLEQLGEAELECAFGCPNAFSEPIIARAGYADVGTLTRFVKVLRGRHVVDRRVRPGGLARAAAALSSVSADPLLSVVSRERRHRRSGALSVEKPAVFDDRFAQVWESLHREHRVTAERSSEVLNWKYDRSEKENGHSSYVVFSLLSSRDSVAGYIVYEVDDGVRDIVDIAFMPSQPVVDALLSEFILDARAEGHGALTVYHLGAAGLLTDRLSAFGFRRRGEHKRLRVDVRPGAEREADVRERENWYFLFGDTDI